jgi:hypothetical protein
MKEQLETKFSEINDLIALLPTNNKSAIEKKRNYIDTNKAEIDELLVDVRAELQKRVDKIAAIKVNDQINDLEAQLQSCNIFHEWTSFNDSYQKLHLDYYLYRLHRYYNDDLISTNECIRKIISEFKGVGIELTPLDFNYNESIQEYMTLLINGASDEELKAKFESLYWKFPQVVDAIELSFKDIYLTYEKKIDKYYEERHKEFLKNHTEEDLKNTKKELIKKIRRAKAQDPGSIIYEFMEGGYHIHDYAQEDIDKKKRAYFGDLNYTYEYLEEFYQVLNDFKIILKYTYYLDAIRDMINNKEGFKNAKSEALKELAKAKKDFKSLMDKRKPKFPFFKKPNDEKWLVKVKEQLSITAEKFDALDQASFKDIIYSRVPSNVSILGALELMSFNFLFFAETLKEHEGNNEMKFISESYEELKDIINHNNFTLLEQISLIDVYDMKQVIVDKYKLDGLQLSVDQLEEGALDKTIADIALLLNYEDIIRSGLSFDDIRLYKTISYDKDFTNENNS